jgi:hypothetical protein
MPEAAMNIAEKQIPECIGIATETDPATRLFLAVWKFPDGRIVKKLSIVHETSGVSLTKDSGILIRSE